MKKYFFISAIILMGAVQKMNAQNNNYEYNLTKIAVIVDKASSVGEFSEGFLNVCIDGKWGYIDFRGETMAPFEYDYAKPFSCGMAKVRKMTQTGYVNGFVDVKGQFVTNDYLMGADCFHDGLAVTFNGEYGIVDKQGRLVVPYQPNRIIEDYKDGMAVVLVNRTKYGAYDTNGRLVIPAIYDGMKSFNSGLALVQIESEQFYVRKNGTRLKPASLMYGENFKDNIATVETSEGRGFMDTNGKITDLISLHGFLKDYCEFEDFSEGLAVVSKFCDSESPSKKGYMNKFGVLVTPTEYDEAYAFCNGMGKVAKNGHYGYVNSNGKLVIDCIYDDASGFSDGIGIVKQNDKYGYINNQGMLLRNIEFDEAQPFSFGIGKVKRNGKIGFVDKNGRCTLDYVAPDSEDIQSDESSIEQNILAQTNESDYSLDGIYNTLNQYKVVYANDFHDGLAKICVRQGKDDLVGLINKKGDIVLAFKYKKIGTFSDGLVVIIDTDGNSGYADKNGNIVVPCIWDGLGAFSEGLGMAKKDGKRAYINRQGEIVTPSFDAKRVAPFNNGLAAIEEDNWQTYFIDQQGEVVIPQQDGRCYGYSEGLYIVCSSKGRYRLIDKSGTAIAQDYNIMGDDGLFFNDGLLLVGKYKETPDNRSIMKYGFMNNKGNLVISLQYEDAKSFSEGYAPVKKGEKWGFVNKEGELVIPCQFDRADSFSEGLAAVCINNKWGFINKEGEIVIPCIFNSAQSFSNGYTVVTNDKKQPALMNKQTQVLIQFGEMPYISGYSDGLCHISTNERVGYIDKEGHAILVPIVK